MILKDTSSPGIKLVPWKWFAERQNSSRQVFMPKLPTDQLFDDINKVFMTWPVRDRTCDILVIRTTL